MLSWNRRSWSTQETSEVAFSCGIYSKYLDLSQTILDVRIFFSGVLKSLWWELATSPADFSDYTVRSSQEFETDSKNLKPLSSCWNYLYVFLCDIQDISQHQGCLMIYHSHAGFHQVVNVYLYIYGIWHFKRPKSIKHFQGRAYVNICNKIVLWQPMFVMRGNQWDLVVMLADLVA